MGDKSCDFCRGFPVRYPIDPVNTILDDCSEGGIFVSMQDDCGPIINIETEDDISYEIPIKYCPFCGRELVGGHAVE